MRLLGLLAVALLAVETPLAVRAEKANVFFIHGANVSENDARAWAAEMFKRMWQAGANCAFTAVTWYGDDSRHWWYLDNTPNYYVNVEHAFESAAALANVAAQLSGEKVIAAHSLGNMLVSSAIADHGMQVSSYFMLNAAVPMEAYDPDEIPPNRMQQGRMRLILLEYGNTGMKTCRNYR